MERKYNTTTGGSSGMSPPSRRATRQPRPEERKTVAEDEIVGKSYKGIRMRKWGKWVAEIREPNKRSRIWLGSYSSPIAAARAYDIAVFLLRGPSAKLNFPEKIPSLERDHYGGEELSAAVIRQMATKVGAQVDAQQQQRRHGEAAAARLPENTDLNRQPNPDSSDTEA